MTAQVVLPAGERYHLLTTVSPERLPPDRHHPKGRWGVRCACDCGSQTVVLAWRLRTGETRSCGCLRRVNMAKVGRLAKHSMESHRHYDRWRHMVNRCTDPTDKSYPDYGGRGITVCAAWRTDPVAFCRYLDEVLGSCPPGHSMDRVDNDGHYEPGNLRWADRVTQNRNRRPRKRSNARC
jgi:hypothetical protein